MLKQLEQTVAQKNTEPEAWKAYLDYPENIVLENLSVEQKEPILAELRKRQNSSSAEITWTEKHVELLQKLQSELEPSYLDNEYISPKDLPLHKRP